MRRCGILASIAGNRTGGHSMRGFASFPSLRRALVLGIALAVSVRPGFAGADEDRDHDRDRDRPVSSSVPGQLAGTYLGFLPCADCMGIRYRLDLMPEGGFVE